MGGHSPGPSERAADRGDSPRETRLLRCRAPGSVGAVRAALGKTDGTGAIAMGDGELRAGIGCYSVLPPSVHPSGHVYRWLIPPTDSLPVIDLLSSGLVSPGISHTPNPQHPPHTYPNTITCDVSDFKTDCLSSQIETRIQAAIESSLPAGVGERHASIFGFARRLKAIPELADAAPSQLVDHVRRWHQRALPDRSGQNGGMIVGSTFLAWSCAKHPAGREPLADVLVRADAAEPPDVALAFSAMLCAGW